MKLVNKEIKDRVEFRIRICVGDRVRVYNRVLDRVLNHVRYYVEIRVYHRIQEVI